MIRFVSYWAIAGFLVPVAIMIIGELQGGVFEWPELGVILWPTWPMMGATYGREWTAFGILILLFSVAINVVLYSAVGVILWRLRWMFSRILK